MNRPVIILADTDRVFVERVAMKFAELYANDIDLYVYSDVELFQSVFQERQKADVLLISDMLWSQDLEKHEIKSIVIINDENRYVNVKSIIHKAMQGLQNSPGGKKNDMIPVSGVISAVGGAGTTLVSLALAHFLSENHQRVLYVNTESIQSFQIYLQDEKYLSSEGCRVLQKGGMEMYYKIAPWIRHCGFDYLPALPASPDTLGIKPQIIQNLVESARESGEYDVIILNLENSFTNQTGRILGLCSNITVLALQDRISALKTEYLLKNLDLSAAEYTLICNQYDPEMPNELLEILSNDLPINGSIKKLEQGTVEEMKEDEGLKNLGYGLL